MTWQSVHCCTSTIAQLLRLAHHSPGPRLRSVAPAGLPEPGTRPRSTQVTFTAIHVEKFLLQLGTKSFLRLQPPLLVMWQKYTFLHVYIFSCLYTYNHCPTAQVLPQPLTSALNRPRWSAQPPQVRVSLPLLWQEV